MLDGVAHARGPQGLLVVPEQSKAKRERRETRISRLGQVQLLLMLMLLWFFFLVVAVVVVVLLLVLLLRGREREREKDESVGGWSSLTFKAAAVHRDTTSLSVIGRLALVVTLARCQVHSKPVCSWLRGPWMTCVVPASGFMVMV